MAKAGKRIIKAREGVDPAKGYSLDEAVKLVKSRATAKFDETIEVAMNLGVDPRHADQMVRGVVGLPNGTGRTTRVAVFARGVKADEARAAGADVVGAEDLVEKVNGGTIGFDRRIAGAELVPRVARRRQGAVVRAGRGEEEGRRRRGGGGKRGGGGGCLERRQGGAGEGGAGGGGGGGGGGAGGAHPDAGARPPALLPPLGGGGGGGGGMGR